MQTPSPVEYERATSIAHALELMERLGPEARVIAGGHSLLPMMRLRLAQPEAVIDINDLSELAGIRVEDNHLVLGAMTRHADVLASAVVGEHYAIFHDAERVIADPIVRNRGTVGGSLCQADPAEDLSAVAAALKATLTLRSSQGERTVEAREFVQGPYETLLGPAEILTAIKIPIRAGAGSAYEKVERRAGDWAIAAAGSFVVLADGAIADVGIGIAAVGAPHQCAPEAEQFLLGKEPSDETLAEAARLAAAACAPRADQRGPVEYKRHLAGELTQRALRRCVARASGSE
ncbi:MAG: xanthine dehydrogenase family protein subunit M [Nocardioidaceae bacterium]